MPDRCALIVANDVYEHDALSRLTAPAHDAEALRAVLGDPQIGGFEVQVVHNQPSHVIRREIANFFADRRPDDVLLLHFSGHGLKSASGALHFAGADTVPTRLSATAVPAEFVNQEMQDSRARRIALFLDCCYGGAFSRGMRARADDSVDMDGLFGAARPDGRGRVVITASSATEFAFEDNRLATGSRPAPSVFTSAVVHALRTGEADTGGDGWVDIDELYDYVYARVRATTSHQTPQKWADLQGRLVIARAPHWVDPVALPAELVTRAGDDRPAERLAAVRDLRRTLLDEDTGRAAGAMDLLRELAADDSREVSAAAAAALEEAQLKPVPDRLDLADDSAPATVRLVGAPLARAFQATTGTRWLAVEQSGSADAAGAWLRISVDPAALPDRSGPVRGSVTVLNRLGEFTIPVTAPSTGRLWSRAAIPVPDGSWGVWAADRRLTLALGAAMLACWPLARASVLHGSSVIGLGYFVLRAALLLLGLWWLDRPDAPDVPDSRRTVGLGLTAASSVYFLTDAVELLYARADVFAWLETAAVLGLLGCLALRYRPFAAVPRRPHLRPPRQHTLGYLPLVALAAQLLLLFVAVPGADVTLADLVGPVALVLAVAPMGALCALAALSEIHDPRRRLFATAAVAAYFGPELYFLPASLLLGRNFTYLGADVGSPNLSAAWFVLAQTAVTATLALSTTALLRDRPLRLNRTTPPG